MNDDLTRGELASAYLDGVLGAGDRARVEADPALLELVDRFRVAAVAVGTGVEPPPPSIIDAAVRRAVSEHRLAPAEAAAPPTPTPLHRPQARRSRYRALRWALPAVAAAAAVAVVVSVVQRDDGETTTAFDATTTAPAPEPGSPAGSGSAEGTGSAEFALAVPDLGPIETPEQLRSALEPLLAAGRDTATAGGPSSTEASPACAAAAGDLAPGTTLAETARLRWQDTDATALLASGPAGREVLVLALDGCGLLARVVP